MNRLLLLTVLVFIFLQCQTQQPTPNLVATNCGVKNPVEDLPWLKDIIVKAKEDKATMAYKGNYMGRIYLETFKDQPIFIVEMAMGSGGLAYYLFQCDGQRVNLTAEERVQFDTNSQNRTVLYQNVP